MTSETLEYGDVERPAIALWRKVLAAIVAVVTVVGFYLLSAGTLVLNGTASLPHNGYAMLHWPIVPWKGGYVAFEAPPVVDARFSGLTFIKRVVGVPGDEIVWRDGAVCVADDCRDLLPSLAERGLTGLPQGRVPDNMYVVFGDADDSLDSRYAVFGLVSHDQITAVGLPAPVPHWKEVQAWFE